MKIRDITLDWVEKELEDISHKPLCYDMVEWYAVLMTLKHRLEKHEDAIEKIAESTPAPIRSYNTLNRHEAREWVSKMRNADGSHGEHWTMDQAKSVQRTHDLKCDEAEFYAIINALYSDYSEVMASVGITDKDVDFWGAFAQAWLKDEDAMPHKAARYLKCIVQK